MKKVQELHQLVKAEKHQLDQKQSELHQLSKADLKEQFISTSNEVWSCSNCLKCANCCKTISPIVEFNDIHNMAKVLNVGAGDFIKTYLEMDEDGDFVFQSQPCPMLNLEDNKCKVYKARPKSCREYPHLDDVNTNGMLDLAFTNAKYCGVVYDTVKKIEPNH